MECNLVWNHTRHLKSQLRLHNTEFNCSSITSVYEAQNVTNIQLMQYWAGL